MKYPRYPAYKDSGVEWLGEVPECWRISTVKQHFAIQLGKMLQNDALGEGDIQVPYLKAVHVNWQQIKTDELPKMWASARDVEQFGVQSGDLLVCEGGEAGRAGDVQRIEQPCIIQNALHRVRSLHRPSLTILMYLLEIAAASGWLTAICNKATITHFTSDKLSNLAFPLAPLDEQATIATFLDRETAKIAALIAKQERMIALLGEKRQALIAHAVTKGLRPAAPMKDSGVPWLGGIPAHWAVRRTKAVARLESGHTPSRQHPEYWENCTIPWISLADVWQLREGVQEYIGETKERISELGMANSAARLLPAGTVIVSRTASVGFSGIMIKPMATTQDFVNWVCGPLIQPEYLLYVFRAMKQEFRRFTMGSTHQTIYMPDVATFVTTVPPRDEQAEIVDFIRESTAKIDTLIAKAQQSIALMREHRTSLIAAAVTGKIDVRSAVAAEVAP